MKKAKLLFALLSLSIFTIASCGQKPVVSSAGGNSDQEESQPTQSVSGDASDPIFDLSSQQGGNSGASTSVGDSSSDITVATAIHLNPVEMTLTDGGTGQITATVLPSEGTFIVDWTSSNTAVATVTNGLVAAVGEGNADITATVRGTTLSEKCVVRVAAAFHDYVKDGSVKLGLEYAGKNFYTDGVEQVSLLTPIDGDTAHFTTSNGPTLKARFFGIDTPESTGKVQEWGVPASNFTKDKLKAADKNGTIVVSSPQSTYGAPG